NQFRRGLDQNHCSDSVLVVRHLFSRWNQTGSKRFRRPDLYLNGFGSDLDSQWCVQFELGTHCWFRGWSQSGRRDFLSRNRRNLLTAPDATAKVEPQTIGQRRAGILGCPFDGFRAAGKRRPDLGILDESKGRARVEPDEPARRVNSAFHYEQEVL